jgi:hypothetical protein
MNSSPKRHTFQKENAIKQAEEAGKEPNPEYIDVWDQIKIDDANKIHDPAWRKNNLEYDLRSTEWICSKAKASETYAQNIYAALCNQAWQQNDVWPLLKGETYSCSWRYAGGIVADMREQGDYIDWYCSGIRSGTSLDDDVLEQIDPSADFVPEGCVTDEIREDFFKLGWIPVNESLENDV